MIMTPEQNFYILLGKCDGNVNDVIENIKCKILNVKEIVSKKYWKECLNIAKQFKNK